MIDVGVDWEYILDKQNIIEFQIWVSNDTHVKQYDMVTLPLPNFGVGLGELLIKTPKLCIDRLNNIPHGTKGCNNVYVLLAKQAQWEQWCQKYH